MGANILNICPFSLLAAGPEPVPYNKDMKKIELKLLVSPLVKELMTQRAKDNQVSRNVLIEKILREWLGEKK